MKELSRDIWENKYLCGWTEEGGYLKDMSGEHHFIDFLADRFELDTEDLLKIAKLNIGESVQIHGHYEYFTVIRLHSLQVERSKKKLTQQQFDIILDLINLDS